MLLKDLREKRKMLNKKPIILAVLLIVLVLPSIVSAVDANARQPYLLEPIEADVGNLKLNGNAKVDLFTGAAIYSYSFALPPGTNDIKPSIDLFYNSQTHGGNPGILGSGWSISGNYVQRSTNHTFVDISDDEFKLVLGGSSYDLVYSDTDKQYHTSIENFFYIQNETGGENEKDEFWILKTKDGTTYRFGFYNYSETLANRFNYVWRWSLDLVNDTYGNQIFYNYTENPYPEDDGTVYLNDIEYNNDKQRKVEFIYGENTRPDLRTLFEDGNRISQTRRLQQIKVIADNNLVKNYTFEYSNLNHSSSLSFLSSITEYGEDGATFLPQTKFEYGDVKPSWLNITNTFESNTSWPAACDIGVGDTADMCFTDRFFHDNGIRLSDINGDGLVDVIKAIEVGGGGDNGESEIWINNGTGWVNNTGWSWPTGGCDVGTGDTNRLCFVSGPGNTGVRLSDIDGDGLPDIVRAKEIAGDNGEFEAWLNNGTGWTSAADRSSSINWTWPKCNLGGSTSADLCLVTDGWVSQGVNLIDINGDTLPDIIKARGISETNGEWEIYLNNGTGWENATGWNYPDCSTDGGITSDFCFITNTWIDNGVRLSDLNGDGLPDLVRAREKGSGGGNGTSEIRINNGTGWELANWTYPFCHHDDSNGDSGRLCFTTSSYHDKGTRLADVNGDGLPDIIRAQGLLEKGVSEIWLNNGTGWEENTTNWIYPDCHNYGGAGNDYLCFTSMNANSTILDNGVNFADLNGDGILDIVRALEKTAGFNGVTSVWNNNASKSYMMKKITVPFGGTISIDYQKSTYLKNNGNDSISDLGFNVWVVANITEDNGVTGEHQTLAVYSYNYSGGRYDYKSREFRGFNFVEEKINDKTTKHWFHQNAVLNGREYKTEVLNSQGDPYKTTEKQWNSEEKTNYYVVELAQESEITYGAESANPKVKNTTYDYDDYGNLVYKHSLGDIDNSNDDRFEYYEYSLNTTAWIVNKPINYSLFDSDNSTLLKEPLYFYDELSFGAVPTKGGLTKEEDILKGGENPFVNYSHNKFGNIANATDANGYTTFYLYGIRDGTNTFADRVKNPKGHQTNYNYDLGTGNLLSETDSNEIITNYTFDKFGRKEKEILPLDTETLPTRTYEYEFDGSAPETIIIKNREENGESETLDEYQFFDGFGRIIQKKVEAPNSQQIVVNTFYNDFGNIENQSNPYFTSFNGNYSIPSVSVDKSSYQYDSLSRVIKIINPDNTVKTISYDHWNITITDENNNKKDYETNAFEKIIKVVEYNESQEYKTNYTYDGSGNIIFIADALGNTFSFEYDTLGRKTYMKDPDLGTWNYTYDAVGNLIEQTDSRNETLTISYDELNRKISETSSDNNINYTYDIGKNGTLTTVQISGLVFNYTYDNRFRKIEEEKIIEGLSFTTQFAYDSLDRIKSKLMPSGENITFTYDNQGLLASLNGLANISYDEKNNPASIIYGNLLITNYTYDSSSFRITEIKTEGKQDLDYAYDNIGNVIGIIDSINGRNLTMEYDDLDRLVHTSIIDSGTTLLSFVYNEIGNMLNISAVGEPDVEFYYDNSLAHAPSKVVYY